MTDTAQLTPTDDPPLLPAYGAPPADSVDPSPREEPREKPADRPAASGRRFNPWWLAPLAMIAGIALIVHRRAAVPERADWKAATAVIAEGLAPGDGVTWAPHWAGEGRLFLHGLPGFHLAEPAEADLARYDRVWLLGAFGRSADDLPAGHRVLDRQTFGPLNLDLVEVGGERVIGDLRADLEAVRVTRSKGDRVERCDFWDGRGWHCTLRKSPDRTRACLGRPVAKRLRNRRRDPHCGLDPWLNVSRDVRVIGDHPRRCVWFHPIGGKTLRAHWPSAPVADGVEAVLDFGFTDKVITDHTRKETRTRPARLRLRQGLDGAVLGEQPVSPEKGWRRWRLPIAPAEGGGLSVEVETEATVDAHLCIDLTLRGPRTGAE